MKHRIPMRLWNLRSMRNEARLLLPLLIVLSVACAKAPRWDVGDEFRARDFLVADALDDEHGGRDLVFDA
jgi:hypothetical protein